MTTTVSTRSTTARATENDTPTIRLAMIGCGGMARHHLTQILSAFPTTDIPVVCEPSTAAYTKVARMFTAAGRREPHNEPDLDRLLRDFAGDLDAAFIITPHAYHYAQTVACLEAGLDVLLEKPMVLNATEAESLIGVRDRTQRLLVVAFNGGLSPEIRIAAEMLRAGDLGELLTINAVVWQNWSEITTGAWRQEPAISGGGFLFDTGAHMLNTVAELAGEDFVEVAAWLTNKGQRVETMGVVMGRLTSGTLVTMNACGETIPSCASDVRVFCTEGILRTGVWGRYLEVQRAGDTEFSPVEVPASMGSWEQFLAVRGGQMSNPCPPETGLRMARLWDAIKESSAQGGTPVTL